MLLISASAFPETDTQSPIFLYSKDNNNVQLPNQLDLPKSPVFPNSVSVENDASLAKVSFYSYVRIFRRTKFLSERICSA